MNQTRFYWLTRDARIFEKKLLLNIFIFDQFYAKKKIQNSYRYSLFPLEVTHLVK